MGWAWECSCCQSSFLPTIKFEKHFEITGADNPAVAAQNLLSARFGIEGSPNVLLIAGGEQEVLRRAEELTAGLEDYQQRGVIKSIFSPTISASVNSNAK